MSETQENQTSELVPSPEFLARSKRINDALELQQPDRIPIMLSLGYLMAEMCGVTRLELYNNPKKSQEILEKLALHFQPDLITGLFNTPSASKILGDRMTKWPGFGLGPNGSFQFNEKEFMKAEDYEALLDDPSDYAIRTYLPRTFSELEGLALLPPLGISLFGYYATMNLGSLAAPPVLSALEALQKATQAITIDIEHAIASSQRLAELGFPPAMFASGVLLEAPFDFMSDTLRGMRGIFLDMMRQPDNLLAAQEKVKNIMIKHALAMVKTTGITSATLTLHRGSDGFISISQFERFYWPQLKNLLLQLIDAGIRPFVFYEGKWDERLKYLTELPKNKTIGLFQSSDIFKVKEVVGNTMCIIGGMPISMLTAGSVAQVREHTQEVCESVGKGGGFIMCTGTLELEGCNPELVKTWVDATKEYGVYT